MLPPEPQRVTTPYLTYLIQGAQWEVIYNDGVDIDLAAAKNIVAHRHSIQKEGSITLLLHGEQKVHIAPKAKQHFASPEGTKGIAAAAILFNSKTRAFVMRLLAWFVKTGFPLGIFPDQHAARAWLREKELALTSVKATTQPHSSFVVDRYGSIMNADGGIVAEPRHRTYPNPAIKANRLTAADLKVAKLLPLGLTSKEMGERLGVSFKTVENRLWRMRIKLRVDNVAALIQKLNDLDILGKNAY